MTGGRLAVVLFNLGGPDGIEAVEPYLRNLFCDPAILRVPGFLRGLLASLIASRRAPLSREIFAKLGGASPIVAETQAQASALLAELQGGNLGEVGIFVAMRYWHPRASEVSRKIAAWSPDRLVLLPLYPQYSTTTTASSLDEFESALNKAGYRGGLARICCYPTAPGFVAALATGIAPLLDEAAKSGPVRLLFSAHGLPLGIVKAGDPYVWQVEATAQAVLAALKRPGLDWSICYQSRVGPLKWTGPSIDEAIADAALAKRAIVLAPIAFVSEHSETLVELDIKYRERAGALGAPAYLRAPTVGVNTQFIAALARLVHEAASHANAGAYCNPRLCPERFKACPNKAA